MKKRNKINHILFNLIITDKLLIIKRAINKILLINWSLSKQKADLHDLSGI